MRTHAGGTRPARTSSMSTSPGHTRAIIVTGRLVALFLVMGLVVIAVGRWLPSGLSAAEYLLVVLVATTCVAIVVRRPLLRL